MTALAITDLSFHYIEGSEELFNGLSHEFAAGQLTAITGPSGRGKSTLLYILGLLLTPSEGTVTITGEPASQLADAKRSAIRASQIGFVFQDSELDPSRTVIDSVIEPALYAGSRAKDARPLAEQLLEEFGLGERAAHRPGEVSGGQAQRVAVCRALINQPSIVLADEPTGNLDRDNASMVLGALRSVAESDNKTVAIASHDPFVLDHCDEVLAL